MAKFVRASKVRHVFGETAKPQFHYTDLRLSPLTGDQQHIKANDIYFAVPVNRGALTVIPIDKPGKLNPQLPVLDGHKGIVIDFDFSKFHRDIVATGGDDCSLKIWKIPAQGMTENIMEAEVDMDEHEKKITIVRFHPIADGVCATGSADHTVKVWDVQTGESKLSALVNEQVEEVVWNYNGSLLASSSKNKMVSLIDPRTGEITNSTMAHDGTKTTKIQFLGDTDKMATVGFSKNSTRSFKIWDLRGGLEKPLTVCRLDQSSGAMMPFYDAQLNILYIGGKGDTNIRYFEITDSDPWQFKIDDFRASRPCKGMCMLPKRTVDVSKHEVAKFLRLTTDSVEPVSFFCPRKSDQFQADIYPPCFAGVPSLTVDQFFNSKDAIQTQTPVLKSMDPNDNSQNDFFGNYDNSNGNISNGTLEIKKSKSKKDLENELNVAKEYILSLRQKLIEMNQPLPELPNELQALAVTEQLNVD